MPYTVTRQDQWMGELMVEISEGGFDYTNPDMLSGRWEGEGETFIDPREAVEQVGHQGALRSTYP